MKNLIVRMLLSSTIAFCTVPCSGDVENNNPVSATVQEVNADELKLKLSSKSIQVSYLGDYEGINSIVQKASEQINKEFESLDSLNLSTKDWYIKHKEIEEKYSDVIDVQETIYDYFSDDELDKLFHVVEAEIGNGTFEQKCNVVSVIWNRLNHSEFDDTLSNILSKDQFSTISNGSYLNSNVSEDTILACEYTFQFGDTTDGCLFFDSNSALNYSFVFNDGAHNFYTM